jgi:hypothetical protein
VMKISLLRHPGERRNLEPEAMWLVTPDPGLRRDDEQKKGA